MDGSCSHFYNLKTKQILQDGNRGVSSTLLKITNSPRFSPNIFPISTIKKLRERTRAPLARVSCYALGRRLESRDIVQRHCVKDLSQ